MRKTKLTNFKQGHNRNARNARNFKNKMKES